MPPLRPYYHDAELGTEKIKIVAPDSQGRPGLLVRQLPKPHRVTMLTEFVTPVTPK